LRIHTVNFCVVKPEITQNYCWNLQNHTNFVLSHHKLELLRYCSNKYFWKMVNNDGFSGGDRPQRDHSISPIFEKQPFSLNYHICAHQLWDLILNLDYLIFIIFFFRFRRIKSHQFNSFPLTLLVKSSKMSPAVSWGHEKFVNASG
jgi:hypothetical protein